MNFDEILVKCGNSHRYQYLLLGLYGFLMVVISMHYFSQNVISFVPEHWCYHKQLENRSVAEIKAIYNRFERPSCTRLATIDLDAGIWNVTASVEGCDRWIYNYDFGFRSMNTELNWVCDAAYKARVGQSFFFMGSMCGTLLFGLLGDRIGRIKALILANWCGFLGDFSTIFTSNLTAFSLTRFISGLAADANSYLMYILVIEYVSPTLRNVGLNTVLGLFYCLGLIGACWLAVLVGHWRIFLICSSVPLLLVTLFYFLVQESAQWLVTNNDIAGAIKRLQRVAKINGQLVTEDDFASFTSYCQQHYLKSVENERRVKLFDMVKTPRMRSTAFKILLAFIFMVPCYNTIARNVEGLGISPFIMFSLNALTLPPAGYLQGWLQEMSGRKTTAISWMVISGIFAVAAGLVMGQGPNQNVVLLVGLTLVARFGVSIADGTSAQLCTELIPTSVRGRGVAVGHVAGFGASFLSPYILHLGTYFKPAPSIIVGLLFAVCAYVCLLLPETKDKKLPMSLEEGEEFGRGERMFDFLQHLRKQEVIDAELQTELKPK